MTTVGMADLFHTAYLHIVGTVLLFVGAIGLVSWSIARAAIKGNVLTDINEWLVEAFLTLYRGILRVFGRPLDRVEPTPQDAPARANVPPPQDRDRP